MSSLGFREGRGERAMKYGRRDVRCSGAPRICSGSFVLPTGDASSTPPGAAPPTPPSTASDPLRRHLPQPYRSRFADTIVNPTGVASPIPFSTLPGPLCQLTSPRPQIRFLAPSSNLPEQLLTPRPRPQIRIVDTILNPTTGAASDATRLQDHSNASVQDLGWPSY